MKQIFTVTALTVLSGLTAAQAATFEVRGDPADAAPYDNGNILNPGASSVRVGNNGSAQVAGVFVFQMPDLGVNQVVSSASFTFEVGAPTGTDFGTSFGVDVSVLRVDSSSDVLASDFSLAGTTVQEDIITVQPDGTLSVLSGLGQLTETDSGGNTVLGSFLSSNYSVDDYVFIRLKADTTIANNNNFLVFSSGNQSNVPRQPLLTLETATVPEPSSFALLGGLFALSCVGIRRRR